MIGVDEAGKGPVLGAMFVAAVEYSGAEDIDVADSKQLSPASRQEVAAEIRERCQVAVVELHPSEIDGYVTGADTSMNDLMVEAHAEALSRLDVAGKAVVDASDTDEERFRRRVASKADGGVEVSAFHGADENYPAVSAASVVAKVARDSHVEEIAENHGVDVGSGYPGDSRTRKFLQTYVERHDELPPETRESWSTSHDILSEHRQSTVTDF